MTDRVEKYDENLFLGYLEGDLTPEQRRSFERQMLDDARLRSLVSQIAQDKQLLRRLEPVQAPAEVMDRANQVLERQMLLGKPSSDAANVIRQVRWSATRLTRFAALAAIVLLGGALLIFTVMATVQSWPGRDQHAMEVAGNIAPEPEASTFNDDALPATTSSQPEMDAVAFPEALVVTAPSNTAGDAVPMPVAPSIVLPPIAAMDEVGAQTMMKTPGGAFSREAQPATAGPVQVFVTVLSADPAASKQAALAFAGGSARLHERLAANEGIDAPEALGATSGRGEMARSMKAAGPAAPAVSASLLEAKRDEPADPAPHHVIVNLPAGQFPHLINSLRQSGAVEANVTSWKSLPEMPAFIAGEAREAPPERVQPLINQVLRDADRRQATDWSALLTEQLPLSPVTPLFDPQTPLQVRIVFLPAPDVTAKPTDVHAEPAQPAAE